jgi:hypothetical protein
MEELRKKIEIKAYEYFLQRGMSHGNDVGDWLRAEREVLKENSNKTGREFSKKLSLKKKK